MAGGGGSDDWYHSVESTFDGSEFTYRPSLPDTIAYGCLVNIDNENLVALAGEGTEYKSKKVYHINVVSSSKWKRLPDMRKSLYSAACGLVTNSQTGQSYIIVSGGHNGGNSVPGSEMYDLQEAAWKTGT